MWDTFHSDAFIYTNLTENYSFWFISRLIFQKCILIIYCKMYISITSLITSIAIAILHLTVPRNVKNKASHVRIETMPYRINSFTAGDVILRCYCLTAGNVILHNKQVP